MLKGRKGRCPQVEKKRKQESGVSTCKKRYLKLNNKGKFETNTVKFLPE